MDRSTSKGSMKPHLITPSASPHPDTLPPRMSGSVPPHRKQRTVSTPRLDAPSNSSRPQTPINVEKEREASRMRLLDVWSSLAARYTKPLDEDDIVDLHNWKITKDNGVLRNSTRLDFGSIAASRADDAAAGAGDSTDEGDEEEDEDYDDVYGVDELDAFAEDIPLDRMQVRGATTDDEIACEDVAESLASKLPTLAPLGPMDADDLREFLDAEHRRRELYGTDGEDDEDCQANRSSAEFQEARSESALDSVHVELLSDENGRDAYSPGPVDLHTEDGGDSQEEEDAHLPEDAFAHHDRGNFQHVSGISEDELDDWTTNGSNAIHLIKEAKKMQQPLAKVVSDSDSDIEFIEPPVQPIKAKALSNARKSLPEKTMPPPQPRAVQKVNRQLQLYTPPLSQSSSRPSETPARDKPPSLPPSSSYVQSGLSKSRSGQSKSKITPPDAEGRLSPVNSSSPVKPPIKSKGQKTSFPSQDSLSSDRSPSKNARKATPIVLLTPRRGLSQKPAALLFDSDNDSTVAGRLEESNPKIDVKGKGKAKETTLIPGKVKHSSSLSGESSARRKVSSTEKVTQKGLATIDSTRKIPPLTASSSPPSKRNFPVALDEDEDENNDPFVTSASRTRQAPGRIPASKNDIPFPQQEKLPKADRSVRKSSRPPVPSPSPRKRKRPSSVSSVQTDESTEDKRPDNRSPSKLKKTSATTPRLKTDDVGKMRKPQTFSSRRKRKDSVSESGSEDSAESSESDTNEPRRGRRSQSRQPHPYPDPVFAHSYPLDQAYPRIPDQRAQLLISQTMQQLSQQLSALVGAAWGPPQHYTDGMGPMTPSHRRHHDRPMPGSYITPTHPHPYPYSYDPNSSRATLPPDSPEDLDSSPVKRSSRRRKSLVHRSQSRGRRVSFNLERSYPSSEEEGKEEEDGHSSSEETRRVKIGPPKRSRSKKKSPDKGKRKQKSRDQISSDDESEPEVETKSRGEYYRRGQTPGPDFEMINSRHGRPEYRKTKGRQKENR
ncbi:hypothetical protein D9613_006036 [Agrocybe pediades]|uniref:Uncharacterized protein n=1 Tax=Agrocybe pediades TaxID=84607 RepID=A0A8H4QVQ1_9AGAR|nr:hypothetical protein D9613_006036 [Agrocybe pediades]